MKNKLLLFLFLATVLVGCRIEKRLYRPGFHVTFHSNKVSEIQNEPRTSDVPEITETKNVLTEKKEIMEKEISLQNEIINPRNQETAQEDQVFSPLIMDEKEPEKEDVRMNLQEEKSGVLEVLMAPALKQAQKIGKYLPKAKSRNSDTNLFSHPSLYLFLLSWLLTAYLIPLIIAGSGLVIPFLIIGALAYIASFVFSIIGVRNNRKGDRRYQVARVMLIIHLVLLLSLFIWFPLLIIISPG